MGRPFSQRVADAAWLAGVRDWIAIEAARAGVTVRGKAERRRVRPWSAQAVVDSDAGPLWFKANCTAMRFEPALHRLLADRAPDLVEQPLALDSDRGWLLLPDRGQTLGDTREPTREDWSAVLIAAGRLQRRIAADGAAILALGVPDCSPTTVVARFDRLLDLFAGLPEAHPCRLGPERAADVRAARPRVVDAAALLAEHPGVVTLQHGDLHPWNVFAADGGYRLFDFGDAQWAHAFEALRIPFAWVTERMPTAWPVLVEQYLDVWGVTSADVADLLAAAEVCHPVNRALTWWTALGEASAEELREWGAAPTHHLYGVCRGA